MRVTEVSLSASIPVGFWQKTLKPKLSDAQAEASRVTLWPAVTEGAGLGAV